MDRLRANSISQTEYLLYLADTWLQPLGFQLGSPRDPDCRGSHISLLHPEAYRISQAMIKSPPPAVRIIPDFRAPDNLRLGIAPIYTRYVDIYQAIARIRQIVTERLYQQYPLERVAVT